MVFDLICAAIALLLMVLGAFRGLIRQLFGVAGFIGGLLLAHIFAEPLAVQLSSTLGLSPTLGTIAFSIAIFIAVEVLASLLGNFLHSHLGAILGTIDRIGGALLGLAKGLLVVWALASLAALMHAHAPQAERQVTFIHNLDFPHSTAVHLASNASFLGDINAELRAASRRR